MFGRLLQTLAHRLDAEEREWSSTNRARKELQPGRIQRGVLAAAQHPLAVSLWLSVILAAVSLIPALWAPEHWVLLALPIFRLSDPGPYFWTLWTVQATFAALVYPIVIAFVTLLLDRRSNAKASLHIYLHYSAAQLSGLTSLLLVFAMGLQQFGLPYVGEEATSVWWAADVAWFCVNMFLTTNFLYRTFEYIAPGKRFQITRQYMGCVAWPREARYQLARALFMGAVDIQLLPGPNYVTAKSPEPSIFLGHIGRGMGRPEVVRTDLNKVTLADVRFRLLRWIATRWFRDARAATQQPPTDTPRAAARKRRERSWSFRWIRYPATRTRLRCAAWKVAQRFLGTIAP